MKNLSNVRYLLLAVLFPILFANCGRLPGSPTGPLGPPILILASATFTPTPNPGSPTVTYTPSFPVTFIPTWTFTPNIPVTYTNTWTLTPTGTFTFTSTRTFTQPITSTPTGTPTSTATFPITFFTGSLTPTPTYSYTAVPDPGTPTHTNTLTITPTLTGSPTFTPSPIISSTYTVPSGPCTNSFGFTCTPTPSKPTTCLSYYFVGDPSVSTSQVFVQPLRTYAQRYDLATAGVVQSIWIEPNQACLVRVGIYNGSDSSNWPQGLVYASDAVTLSPGLDSIPVPSVNLAAGTYWLAYEVLGTAGNFSAAAGSTALTDTVWLGWPSPWLTCPSMIATPTPTVVCTPPPYATTNQIAIYALVCL